MLAIGRRFACAFDRSGADRSRSLFRGTRGFISGWKEHDFEDRIEVDGEHVLRKMPSVIYIEVAGADWEPIHPDLPRNVFPLTPVSRTWKVNKYTHIQARRTGFWLIADFGSTAHMIQGQSLNGAFADAENMSMQIRLPKPTSLLTLHCLA